MQRDQMQCSSVGLCLILGLGSGGVVVRCSSASRRPGLAEIESVGVAPLRGLVWGGPPRRTERPLIRLPLAVKYCLVPPRGTDHAMGRHDH